MNPQNPLIAQPDLTILLEVNNRLFKKARAAVSSFLELMKSPKLFHSYHLNEVSLWNGLTQGLNAEEIIGRIEEFSKFPIPETVTAFIKDNSYHYGLFKLKPFNDNTLLVECADKDLLFELSQHKEIRKFVLEYPKTGGFTIPKAMQGVFKSEMIRLNFPVEDMAGFQPGDSMDVQIKNKHFSFRDYQIDAAETFMGKDGSDGAGVIVLPCGAGKTIVGIYVLIQLKMSTLIITPSVVALHQWKKEILRITDLNEEDIGEYSGEKKEIKPLTLVTYQILVYRKNKKEDFKHFELFFKQNWGLVIYDEIHLLPAPIFRTIASIQSKRRLGLTATLIREDNKQREVFALIGPKKYDMPWKDLEKMSFIASAYCYEIKVPIDTRIYSKYFEKSEKARFRLASENPNKLTAIEYLFRFFLSAPILIIGQYIDQLEMIAETFKIDLVTGENVQRRTSAHLRRFYFGENPKISR